MTPKNEKRIAVVEFEGEFLRTQAEFYRPDGGHTVRLRNVFGMTRDEAVKIMSEAMFSKNNATPLYIYDDLAEKALDALINSQDNDHVDEQKRITDGD